MQDRLIAVGEDLTIPENVKVTESSLPKHLTEESLRSNYIQAVTNEHGTTLYMNGEAL